jgi:hypothetical protein
MAPPHILRKNVKLWQFAEKFGHVLLVAGLGSGLRARGHVVKANPM